jgi:heme-degrading monooxygenase HmoA
MEVAMPAIPWRRLTQPEAEQEYLVMASRLPLHSYRTIPRFLGLTLSVARQLERTEGLIGYSLLAQPTRKTFWTLSAWRDQQALHAFVRTLPHLNVMKVLRPYMGPTKFTTWQVRGAALPVAWDDAIETLVRSSTSRGSASPPQPRMTGGS